MPWRRAIYLLWHDLRSEVPPDRREQWDAWWDTPIREDADDEVLQSFIDSGQAIDMEDAQFWLDHLQRIDQAGSPIEAARMNADFAAARRARLAAATGG